jgi:hypothetical protein
MKKKEESAKPAAAAPKEEKKKIQVVIPETPDRLAGESEDEKEEGEEEGLMYGHADDVVWTDKSHAIRDAEAAGEEEDDKVCRHNTVDEEQLFLLLVARARARGALGLVVVASS